MAEYSLMSQAYTDSNSRCMKCVFVVLEVFPEITLRIMEQSGISAKSLYNRIQKDQRFRKRLTKTDHQTINTLVSDGYTMLDLTLMFKLIRHYSNMFIDPPTRGWKSDPLPSEITIGDDIQRLRLKRNHYLHKMTIELSEQDCNDFFSEVILICERVDRFLNCTEEESFKSRIETLNSQPFEATEELKKQYDKEKFLEEYFVTVMGNLEVKVFKAKSLKNFIKEINERRDHHDGSCSAIKLTFPDISNPEFTEIMSNLRGEINQGLVNIEIESINDGSLVMDIVVQTPVLLNDEGLKRELVTLLTHLLTIRECEEIFNTLPVVAMVLSESLACDDHDDIVDDEATIYPKGSIQLNLRVNNNILQSEEIFKSEVEGMLDAIVSHSNGNTVFPIDKPVVSVIEPGLRDDSKKSSAAPHPAEPDSHKEPNTTTNEQGNQNRDVTIKVESINLQLLKRSKVQVGETRTRCCTLPNGLLVITSEVDSSLLIMQTDGSIQSKIKLPLNKDAMALADITATNGSCVAVSILNPKVILIIDVIKEDVVNGFKTKYKPTSITYKDGYCLYSAHGKGIVKLDIQHSRGKEQIIYSDSNIHKDSTTIASNGDRICYGDQFHMVTVLDSEYIVKCKCDKLNTSPDKITIDDCGFVYIIDEQRKRITAISLDGMTIRDILGKDGGLMKPTCVHYDRFTQQLIVVDKESVLRYAIKFHDVFNT